jgi:quinoprotein glucose dehydrogenase
MRMRMLILSSCVAAGGLLAAAQQRSIWDGVYTTQQADRGGTLYAQQCAQCHGDTLGGVESAPALAGDVFNNTWEGMMLDALLERMRSTMPQDKPGTLTRAQNADVLAHMLRAGSFPAGAQELPGEAAPLAGIRFLTYKPQE